MAKQYELTYTVSKNMAQEEASRLFEKVISYLPQVATSMQERDFFTAEFYAEPETIDGLNQKLKSEPQVSRYLIAKSVALKPMKIRRTPQVAAAPPEEQKVEKVELKEIDQKLKEIFGE